MHILSTLFRFFLRKKKIPFFISTTPVSAEREAGKRNAGGGKQPILACGGGEFREPGAEHETAMLVAQYEAMAFKRNGQAVRGRTGETRGAYQLP